MKKYITLILASALLLTSISCGSESSDNETTTASGDTTAPAETTAPEETDGLPDTDMEGFELKINHFDAATLSWALVQLDAEGETGDRLSDAIYRRNRGIEERFNCTISVTGQNMIESNDIAKEVMAGDSNYDLWLSYDIWTLGAVEALLPWEEIPYVNLDKEWWNPMATEVFQLGGKTYAAAGNYSLSVLSRASGFVFNK
ncbi:MAG: acid shock protein, partial [Candidatus Flemingiibacterium sp.]